MFKYSSGPTKTEVIVQGQQYTVFVVQDQQKNSLCSLGPANIYVIIVSSSLTKDLMTQLFLKLYHKTEGLMKTASFVELATMPVFAVEIVCF